eukprot:UN05707
MFLKKFNEESSLFCSDVQELLIHPDPYTFNNVIFDFPFEGNYLCTQAVNGQVTHYYAPSYHAIDFRIPIGTPLLAMADGIIHEIKQNSTVSGIHVENLYHWNSITILTNNNLLIEYDR